MSKLSYEDKVNLYKDRKKGMSYSSICSKYNVNHAVVEYLISLINKHGYKILKSKNNKKYSKEEKERIIKRVLYNHESLISVAIDEGLLSKGMLSTWISKYKENGYNIVE